MFATCGKPKLSEPVLAHLRDVGQAIHAGHQPLVFDGGFVSLVDQRESEVNLDAPTSTGNRSTSRQGQGQRTSRRSRPSGQAQSFRSRVTEEAHGAGFRLLAQHYEALGFEHESGLWVAVKAKPLGPRGPQAHFLIGVPNNPAVLPRGWAFREIGTAAKPFPLKHTNFPDASICAFTQESMAWTAEDGLLPLVDHYSLWVVKSWHRQIFGWWPGPQVGKCALYRRNEFDVRELCGCESGRPYGFCHYQRDKQVPDELARREFTALFGLDYENRQTPTAIVEAARTRWRTLPALDRLIS